jgi:hypothetical protein
LRLPEASQTPPGAASSAPPSFADRLEAYATLLLGLANLERASLKTKC